MSGGTKTDNAKGGKKAKIELRLKVLDLVKPAHVFDAFCGLGEMYRAAWSKAESYVGCDHREWTTEQGVSRYVADNRLVMRSLDLAQFNVFDIDAYGSPWDQMLILAARRKWQEGERGAVILTDGSAMRARYGGVSSGMGQLLGGFENHLSSLPRSEATATAIQSMLLTKWCAKSGVRQVAKWKAERRGPGFIGMPMTYTALVFEGSGSAIEERQAAVA